jgi:hypothetical protein
VDQVLPVLQDVLVHEPRRGDLRHGLDDAITPDRTTATVRSATPPVLLGDGDGRTPMIGPDGDRRSASSTTRIPARAGPAPRWASCC